MKSDQVGNEERSVEQFFVCSKLSGILNDRQRCGHSLIAAARADDNGKLTAIHAGIRARCSTGFCPCTDIVSGFKENLADVCSVIMAQPLLGYRCIEFNLAVQDPAYILQITGACEIINISHGQKIIVRQILCIFIRLVDIFFK